MSLKMKMWKIDGEKLQTMPSAILSKEEHLENWLAQDISILGLDLLVFGRQVVTCYGGKIDLLGMDEGGGVHIIELKRDKTPREVVAQVLDYASWVKDLGFASIDAIAQNYLQKDIALAYYEKFGDTIPDVNEYHAMTIVASELDDSSERIVDYLATEYRLNINCVYFNIFADQNHEFLGRSWLMDPEEVTTRNVGAKRAPWTGVWYYNVGEGDHRNWQDYLDYGFISAGQGVSYSKELKRLREGDAFFAYMKSTGYVGYGEVVREAVPIDQFEVDGHPGKKLYDLDLKQPGIATNHDNDLCEWVVAVKWHKTFNREDAKTYSGIFANQHIVCRLCNPETLVFLKKEFDVTD